MMDLTGFRAFSLEPFVHHLTPGIYQSDQLIHGCQMKHLGYVDGLPSSEGAKALAHWLIEHAAILTRPVPGNHPLRSGTLIERVLAGELVPEERFAIDLAEMTEGAVLPEMFGRMVWGVSSSDDNCEIESSVAEVLSPPAIDGKASGGASLLTPKKDASPAPSTPLPTLGALGGALPPGRLFHPIADARFGEGFVLTGCGIGLCLDESTALAMRDAIEAGIDYLRARRLVVQSERQAA